MRIGIFDPYLDDIGGGEKYIISMASCLSKIHVVNIFWDDKTDLEKIRERFALDISNISCVPNIFSKKVSFLDRVLATRGFDVIIFLSDGSIPFSLSKKLFVHIQQPIVNISTFSFIEKFKISRVTQFFCNSFYTKSFIDKKYLIKSLVIYPPVFLYLSNVKKENYILHVGRFRVKNVGAEDYKKQHVMIDVFKEMVEAGLKGWKFVLAVSVSDDKMLQFREMQKLASGFPIEFLINFNNKKLWEIYNRSKIYWHASGFGENLQKHPEYAEHFGISTVEAMGAGTVPVVINAGGQKEIVTNGENGFLWDTLDELKKRTQMLIKNPPLFDGMSMRARKRAKEFAGNQFCKEAFELIEGKKRKSEAS